MHPQDEGDYNFVVDYRPVPPTTLLQYVGVVLSEKDGDGSEECVEGELSVSGRRSDDRLDNVLTGVALDNVPVDTASKFGVTCVVGPVICDAALRTGVGKQVVEVPRSVLRSPNSGRNMIRKAVPAKLVRIWRVAATIPMPYKSSHVHIDPAAQDATSDRIPGTKYCSISQHVCIPGRQEAEDAIRTITVASVFDCICAVMQYILDYRDGVVGHYQFRKSSSIVGGKKGTFGVWKWVFR